MELVSYHLPSLSSARKKWFWMTSALKPSETSPVRDENVMFSSCLSVSLTCAQGFNWDESSVSSHHSGQIKWALNPQSECSGSMDFYLCAKGIAYPKFARLYNLPATPVNKNNLYGWSHIRICKRWTRESISFQRVPKDIFMNIDPRNLNTLSKDS